MSHITTEAAIMLAMVWAVILANTGYCFFRLMTSRRKLGSGDG
jgi:hypothetical protein